MKNDCLTGKKVTIDSLLLVGDRWLFVESENARFSSNVLNRSGTGTRVLKFSFASFIILA